MVVRDAATVLLVRDAPEGGLEVLLVQRNLHSDFAAGAHVFPGGAVEPADLVDGLHELCAGRSDVECSARLGVDRDGLALWVAAVRECFEEVGILLARRRGDAHPLSFADPVVAARFTAHRADVSIGRPLVEVLADEALVIDVDRLHYVSHWITPEGASRRFDTRFFVAEAPPEQVARHDEAETVASTWMRPQEALAGHERGELELVLPTIRNLETVLPFARVGHLIAAARALEHVPTIRPRLAGRGAGTRVLLPGDPGYDEAGAAAVGGP